MSVAGAGGSLSARGSGQGPSCPGLRAAGNRRSGKAARQILFLNVRSHTLRCTFTLPATSDVGTGCEPGDGGTSWAAAVHKN